MARDPSRTVGEPRRGAALVRLQGNHDECGQGLDRDRLTGRGESGIRGAGVRMDCPDWCRSRCLALSLRCSLTRNGACFLPRTWRGHQTRKMPPAPMRFRGRRSFWGCVFLWRLVGDWCRHRSAQLCCSWLVAPSPPLPGLAAGGARQGQRANDRNSHERGYPRERGCGGA